MSAGREIIRSRTVVLPVENIDTDQIIPARFLTTTERAGLGRCLFHDWRFTRMAGRAPISSSTSPPPTAAMCWWPGVTLPVARRASTRRGRCWTTGSMR